MSDYRDRIYASYVTGEPQLDADALWHRLRRWIPGDRNIACLDVGCGSGGLVAALAREGYANSRGVDRSPAQVALAQRHTDRVSLADAMTWLGAHEGEYDLVTALDLIEHLRKDELLQFLDLALRALRPGGRLIVQTPNAGSPWGMRIRYGDLTHELALDVESLSQALRICGFEAFEARECEPYVHGGKSAVRWLGWKALRQALRAWDLIETGATGGAIYTRVFMAKADKPRR